MALTTIEVFWRCCHTTGVGANVAATLFVLQETEGEERGLQKRHVRVALTHNCRPFM